MRAWKWEPCSDGWRWRASLGEWEIEAREARRGSWYAAVMRPAAGDSITSYGTLEEAQRAAEALVAQLVAPFVEAEASRVRHEMDLGDRDPSAVGGCGDNSCVVERPRGMATNGGCRCGRMALRMALQRERKATATAAAAERAALRAEIESRSADAMRANGEPSTRGFAAGFEARALDSLLAWLDARKDGAK